MKNDQSIQHSMYIDKETIKPIREAALESIREAIVKGHFAPGEQLKERELSDLMGVSTTPIKEAFRILGQEGLIETIPRKGTFVSEVVDSSIEEILMLKAHLESLAARFAATKITAAELTTMENLMNKMKALTEQKKTEELNTANSNFHSMIREVADNNMLHKMLTTVTSFDNSFRKRALRHHYEINTGYQEHKKIFDAIKAKDADLAESLMRNHIRRTTKNVLEHKEK